MSKEYEVKTGEYLIKNREEEAKFVTKNLGAEIVLTCFSEKLDIVAMGRNLNNEQLKKLFSELNPKKMQDRSLIAIRIIGGDDSSLSQNAAQTLVEQLKQIDNNTDILNIISYDVGKLIHPDSVALDCYHGGINKYEGQENKNFLSFQDRNIQAKNKNTGKGYNFR